MIQLGQVDVASKAVSSVTTVSGLPFAPAAVIFFARHSSLTGVGSNTGGGGRDGMNFGVLTAAAQFSVHSNRYLTDAERKHSNANVADWTWAGAGGGIFTGVLTSDGFQLTCTDDTGANNFLYYAAIGGAGISATAGTITAPGSPGVSSYSIGMRPHLLLNWTVGTLVNTSNASDLFGMGMIAHDLSQTSYAGRSGTNAAAGSTEYCTDQEGFACLGTTALSSRGVLSSWNASGFSVNWSAAASDAFHYLAIRGVSSRITSFLMGAALNDVVSVSGLPWQPDAGITLSCPQASATFHTPGTPTTVTATGASRRRRFTSGVWTSTSARFGHQSNTYDTNNLHETYYGRGMIAGVADQASGIRRHIADINAITADGFSARTVEASSGFGAQRPVAVLVLNNAIPADRGENAPLVGS